MKKLNSVGLKCALVIGMFFLINKVGYSQAACTVPTYTVDISANPEATFTTIDLKREVPSCCTDSSSGELDDCIVFYLVRNENSAGVTIELVSGPNPSGNLNFFINGKCSSLYSGGVPQCVPTRTGLYTDTLTFCKNGAATNKYKFTSLAKPTMPNDVHFRDGCSAMTLQSYGISGADAVWNSVYPGARGAYNSFLSDTSAASPTYNTSFDTTLVAPDSIRYELEGSASATICSFPDAKDTMTVYNYAELTGGVSVPGGLASFCSGGDVLIKATSADGVAPYTYLWANGSSTNLSVADSLVASVATTYTVTIGDAADVAYCPSIVKTITIGEVLPPVPDAGKDQFLCATDPVVNLLGSVQNATGGAWTGGSGTYDPSDTTLNTLYTPTSAEILSGKITFTLTSTGAGGGCTNSTDVIDIFFSDTISVSIPSVSLGCNNSVASLKTVVTGGTSPFSYDWNTSETTDSINVGEGNYSVVVTDSIGCTGIQFENVVAPSALSVSIASSDATTDGGTDGLTSVSASGGTAPYTYLWSPGGQTTSSITGLGYGIYSVIVKDNNLCEYAASVVINEPRCSGFNLSATSTNVSCYGSSNGTGISYLSGGIGPYTYLWNSNPTQTTANATGLKAGAYSIIATDSSGCTQTANIIVSQPTQITNVMNQINNTVVGDSLGWAKANPLGGTAPYEYTWSPGNLSTQEIDSLASGIYSVTITDSLGCSKIDSLQILSPDCSSIVLNVVAASIKCYGDTTGTASISIVGATPPYTYSWSGSSETTSSIDSLVAGNYVVTVTDSLQCSVFRNYTITAPSQLSTTISSNVITCHDNTDGTADLSVYGGTYPYTYDWTLGGLTFATTEDIINLMADTIYEATVTDAKGCTDKSVVSFTNPDSLIASYTKTEPTCNEGGDGSIDVTVSGGVTAYYYNWSTNATTQDLSGLYTNTYTVNVSDANGCELPSDMVITLAEPDSVQIDSHAITCSVPGSGKSLVTIVPTGGNPGQYQVSFDNGLNYQDFGDYDSLLANGATYLIHVKDTTGCVSFIADTVVINPTLNASSITSTDVYCKGASTGSATVNATGGAGNYTYSWAASGATGQTASNLTAASYTVTVTDSIGCVGTGSVTINEPLLALTATITAQTNVYCKGGSTGSATVTAEGGSESFSYAWSTAPTQTTATATGLSVAIYTVTVTDNNGCTVPVEKTVNITEPALALSLTNTAQTNVLCKGGNTGSATFTAGGGSLGYNYLWSNTQTTATATGLTAGTYTLTLTDTNGCLVPVIDSVVITEPDSVLGATISTKTNVFCFGDSTGTATVLATGGSDSYLYSWNTTPSQTGATATGLKKGSYTVTVSDANGCTVPVIKTVSINQPGAALAASISSSTNVYCKGDTTGRATVAPSGGSFGYTYSWNTTPVQTTQTAFSLSAGTYSVTVTDTNGCLVPVVKSVTITEPSTILSASISDSTNIFCKGDTTGRATVRAIGGSGSYSYLWSDALSQTDSTAFGLVAGSYTVTVSDNNNCRFPVDVVVNLTEPLLVLTATVTASTDNLCKNDSIGTATVTAGGGSGSFSYSWNTVPVQTATTATALKAGTYIVTVSDNNGCLVPAKDTVTIAEPTAILTATITASTNELCKNDSIGTATVTAGGGSESYSYSWNSVPVQTTATATALKAGTYTVTVSDNNGCVVPVTDVVTITEPAAVLTATITASTNELCKNDSIGTATVTAQGGSESFSYSWNSTPVQTTATATALKAGSYTVTVSDNNGCLVPVIDTITISEPADTLGASISAQTNVSCKNGSNGLATVTATGGSLGYTYLWNNLQTTATATGLVAGSYTVTVSDTNGCAVPEVRTVVITEPTILSLLATPSDETCDYLNDGSIISAASGGTSPYTYVWAHDASTTSTITGLVAGTYTVTATDSLGCTAVATAVVDQPDPLAISFIDKKNVKCFAGTSGAVTASVTGGTANYTYAWLPGGQTSATVTGLIAGTYTLTVSDAQSCTETSTVIITEPTLLSAAMSSTSALCYGDSTGSVTATPSGGTSPYTYVWSITDSIGQTVLNQPAGTKTVYVKDSNKCVTTNTVTVSEPTEIVLTPGSEDATCLTSNGKAFVSVSGGTGPYTYSWSTGATTDTIFNVASGIYTYTVTDNNVCTSNGVSTVNDNGQPVPTLKTKTNVSCFGGSDGVISFGIVGGTPPYTIEWDTEVPADIYDPITNPGGVNLWDSTINNRPNGTYTATITDVNGCKAFFTETITAPTKITSIVNGEDVSCYGGTNGIADVEAFGGTPGYTYVWLPGGSTGSSVSGLSAGTFTVQVTDTKSCVHYEEFQIEEPEDSLSVIASSTPVLCYGANNGTIAAVASGGTPFYSYLWMPGDLQGESQSNLAPNTYTVTVVDDNSCVQTDTITVLEPAVVALVMDSINSNCSLANGQASVIATGGTETYTYSWAPSGGTNATATGLLAGTYTVTVMDGNSCTKTASVTVLDNPSPIATVASQTNVFCKGLSTGSATLSVTSGSSPFTYSWSPSGGTAITASNLAAASYTATVTDMYGCTSSPVIVITEPSDTLGSSITAQTNVFCKGDNTGIATVTATGGSLSYSYSWSNGQTVATATGLIAGTYSITVNDNNGCTVPVTKTVTITEPADTLGASITSQTDVACKGASTGIATVTATGGSLGYFYEWSNGQTTATATGLAAGTYTVTVSDTNGCTVPEIRTVTITEPPLELNGSITSKTNVFCKNGNTGSATITATGGSLSYSYLWSNSQTTATATGLVAGTYTITVNDTNGCTTPVEKYVTITEPADTLGASITAITDVYCRNGNTGAVTVKATGGSFAYNYLWNNNETTATVSGLFAGTYTVTVSDQNGCTVPVVLTATVTEPSDTLGASITAQTNVFCKGGNTGSATVTATGGSLAYSYSWSNFETGASATGLPAGTYTVTVTDNNGCTVPVIRTVTVTEPDNELEASITSQTNVFCKGGNTGSATVTATGGSLSYSYLWSNSQTTATATGLVANTYSVIITDNNGCPLPVIETIIITEPVLALSAVISSQTNVYCKDDNTGTATVTASGGSVDYTYLWSNGQTTATATGLIAATYSVTVSDNNGCLIPVEKEVTITQPNDTLGSTIISQTNVFCKGGSTGSATVAGSGGSLFYFYSWSNAQEGPTATGLSEGTYTVTISDDNGCAVPVEQIVMITEPNDTLGATITSQTNVYCRGDNTGEATVTATGGSFDYAYLWSDGQTTETATGLQADSYTVSVTDNNGCLIPVEVSVNITEPNQFLTVNVGSQIDAKCKGGNGGSATVFVEGGSNSYSYSWSTTPAQTTATATGLTAGSYSLTVTDNNGCATPVVKVITIMEPAVILDGTISKTDVFCKGGNSGTALVNPSGGSGGYLYSWSTTPVQTTATATGLTAGTYTMVLSDSNGCITPSIISVTVEEPDSVLSSSITAQTNVYCTDGDGSAEVTGSGGSGGYSYEWSTIPVQTTAVATGLSAGSYTVAVTDNNGCITPSESVVTILAPLIPLDVTTSKTNVLCNGENNGTATVNAVGGSGSYLYSWNTTPVQTTKTISGLAAGSYTVTVNESNGCAIPFVAKVVITEPALPLSGTITNSVDIAGCNGDATGSATVTAAGGVQPYSYLWTSLQTAPNATLLRAGVHYVTITDKNGCIFDVSPVTISEPELLAGMTSVTPVTCESAKGKIDLTATGGTLPLIYSWSNGSTTEDLTGLSADTYTVVVTDARACVATVTAEIISDPMILDLYSTVYDEDFNLSAYHSNDGAIDLTVTGDASPFTYSWSNGATTEDISGLKSGTFTVTVTDSTGCIETESITLKEQLKLIIPTGITPNGDAFNENFVVKGLNPAVQNHFIVFNRWGNLVFEKENYTNNWNGVNSSGQDLPEGTYFIILEINNKEETFNGYLDIRR